MPIIPLLQEPGPLPDAPPAVLDRERRPEVDLRGVQRAVGQLAQASRREPLPANQLTAPYEALGAVGRAIAETGSIVGALAKKRYEAETRTQVIEGSAAMEAEIAGFRSQLQQNPKLSPNEWNPALAQHLAGMAQRLDARKDLTADARAELSLRLRTQEKETLISTRLDADKTIFARARDAHFGEARLGITTQIRPRFDAALRGLTESGLAQPYEIEALENDYRHEAERQAKEQIAAAARMERQHVQQSALADPHGWRKANPEPWAGREELWRHGWNVSDERIREGTAALVGDVVNRMVMREDQTSEGAPKISSAADIEAIRSPFLTPTIEEQLKKRLEQHQRAKGRDEAQTDLRGHFQDVYAKISAYDRTKDPHLEQYIDLVVELEERLPRDKSGYLRSLLSRKVHGQRQKLGSREKALEETERVLDGFYQGHHTRFPRVVRPAEVERIRQQRGAILGGVSEWLSEDESNAASPEALHKKIKELIATKVSPSLRDFSLEAAPRRFRPPISESNADEPPLPEEPGLEINDLMHQP